MTNPSKGLSLMSRQSITPVIQGPTGRSWSGTARPIALTGESVLYLGSPLLAFDKLHKANANSPKSQDITIPAHILPDFGAHLQPHGLAPEQNLRAGNGAGTQEHSLLSVHPHQ